MHSSTKKAVGQGWRDVGVTHMTDDALTCSLSWLYPLYEFQNGSYMCSQISILNMCNHLEEMYPGGRVPDEITDPMLPFSSSYYGILQAKRSK